MKHVVTELGTMEMDDSASNLCSNWGDDYTGDECKKCDGEIQLNKTSWNR